MRWTAIIVHVWTILASFPLTSGAPVSTSIRVPLPTRLRNFMDSLKANLTETRGILSETFSDPDVTMMFQDPFLTYGQLLELFLELRDIHEDFNSSVVVTKIPSNLLTVFPSHVLLEIKSNSNQETMIQLTKHVPEMLEPQQHALLQNFIQLETEENQDIEPSKLGEMFGYLKDAPTGLATLSKFYGPNTLKGVFEQFITFYNSLPEKPMRDRVIGLLPWSLRRVIFEETKALNQSNPGLSTLTCHDLTSIKELESFSKLAFSYERVREDLPLSPYPKHLLMCMREKLIELLKETKEENESKKSILDHLTIDEARRIGGSILSSFDLEDIMNIEDDELALVIHQEIGSMAPIDIITSLTIEKAENLSAITFNRLGKSGSELSLDDLSTLGSFIFYLDPSEIERIDLYMLNTFLDNFPFGGKFQMIGCMSKKARETWGKVISKTLSQSPAWNYTALYVAHFSDLFVTLNEEQLSKIDLRGVYYVASFISGSTLNLHLQSPPYFSTNTKVAEICNDWLGMENDFIDDYERFMRFFVRVSHLIENIKPTNRTVTSEALTVLERRRRQASQEEFSIDRKMEEKIFKSLTEFEASSASISTTFAINVKLEQLHNNLIWFSSKTFRLNFFENINSSFSEILEQVADKSTPELNFELSMVTNALNNTLKKNNKLLASILGLTHKHLDLERDEFCSYFATICESPYYDYYAYNFDNERPFGIETLKPDSIKDTPLPTKFTCNGIKRAIDQGSAVVLGRSDFEAWTREELEDCMEFIGMIKWDLEKKQDIVSLLEEKKVTHVTLKKINHLAAVVLNNLLEPFVYDDKKLSKMNLTAILRPETISLLSQFKYEEASLLESIVEMIQDDVEKVLNATSLADSVLLKVFAPLAPLACGFNETTVAAILDRDVLKEFILPLLGRIKSCPNRKALEVMAKSAKSFYGAPSSWSAAVIHNLGIVVAGLNANDFAEIGDCCLEVVSREAISHLTPKHFSALKEDQVSKLSYNALLGIHRGIFEDKEDESSEKSMKMDKFDALNKTVASVQDPVFYSRVMKEVPQEVKVAESKDSQLEGEAESEHEHESKPESEPESEVSKAKSIRPCSIVPLCLLIILLSFRSILI